MGPEQALIRASAGNLPVFYDNLRENERFDCTNAGQKPIEARNGKQPSKTRSSYPRILLNTVSTVLYVSTLMSYARYHSWSRRCQPLSRGHLAHHVGLRTSITVTFFPHQFRERDSGSVSHREHLSGMPIRRDCVRSGPRESPASFAPIQCLNQFLNKQSQFGGVSLICHRHTKLAPIFLHTVSHSDLRYFGGCCECYSGYKAGQVP
jgi:hypothetical protein